MNNLTKTKIIVIAILLGILTLLTSLSVFKEIEPSYTAVDSSYEITAYDIKMVVGEDATIDVDETITATFNDFNKHGIYRTIPTTNTLVINEKGKNRTITQSIEIYDIKGNQNAALQKDSDSIVIRFGSEDSYQPVREPVDFTLSYKVNLGKDYAKTFDMFYYNILGPDWTCDISNLTFSISMPKDFDTSLLSFFKGKMGESNKYTDFELIGNTIIGSVDYLDPHEALTISLSLPEGYFDAEYVTFMAPFVIMWISVACVVLTIIFLLIKDKKPLLVQPVEFYAPDDMNPVQIASIIRPRVNNKDITSLIVYFASKKYLKIRIENDEIILTKTSEIDQSAQRYEQDLFNKLFETGDEINLDDAIHGKTDLVSYIDTDGKEALKSFKPLPQTVYDCANMANLYKPVKKRDSKKNKALFLTSVIVAFVCVFAYASITALLGLCALFGLVYSCSKLIMHKDEVNTSTKVFLSITGVVCLANLFMSLVLDITNISYTRVYIPYVIFACVVLVVILASIIPAYTKEQTEKLGRVLGFKNFLLNCKKDQMDLLIQDNPEYFFDVLPYAYVFGITDKFINRFEGLGYEIRMNDYYAFDLGHFALFNVTLNSTLNTVSRSYTTRSGGGSGGGGFSSGGGGFSGGGFGGGGGGSW